MLEDREVLLAHLEYPAEHWIHLLNSRPISSP